MEPDSFDYIIAINVFQVAPIEVVEALYKLGESSLRSGGKVVTYSPSPIRGCATPQKAMQPLMKGFASAIQSLVSEASKSSACAERSGFANFESIRCPPTIG